MFLYLTGIGINFKLIVIKKAVILPTNVHLVKPVVFPVVMYGCESWTIKKSAEELMLFSCGVGEAS